MLGLQYFAFILALALYVLIFRCFYYMLCVARVVSTVSLLNTVLFVVLMCKNIFISLYSIIPKGCTPSIEMWSNATERVKRLQILGNKQTTPSILTL